jgi:WD40 repeat protein/predicted Ser/Thr protein kinase
MKADEPESPPEEDLFTALLSECDEALAAGSGLLPLGAGAPADLQPRLERDLACLQLLHRLRPSRLAGGPPPDLPGYELVGELGRGGMGVVYQARQTTLNRLVALKMILAGPRAGPRERARFQTEAEAVARLQHPNIVQIHEVGKHDGRPYLCLEYVDGASLAQRYAATRRPPDAAARLVEALARAVDYAHRQGVVHRDLKPANVLLTADGVPKVTDFGLAKRAWEERGLTQSGSILGSPSYMAPEQAGGKVAEVGPLTDVYALGGILYELLTGRPAFRADSVLETLRQVQTQDPVPPCRLRVRVPRDLETICLKCLRKEPARRYCSALDLAEDLERFLAGKPIQARRTGGLERAWRWCRRNPALASLGTGVAALLLVIAGGATGSAVWLAAERDAAQSAEQDATERLWASYLAQAQAGRWSRRPGQRHDGLRALAAAAAIRPSVELRNEAIGCLALADIRLVREVPVDASVRLGLAFDGLLDKYAYSDDQGNITVRRVGDDLDVAWLPGPGERARFFQLGPDGRFLVARHHPPDAGARYIRVWDLSSAATVRKGPVCIPNGVWGFSSDSRELAVAFPDGSINLYDLPGLRNLRRLATGATGPMRVVYHPNSRVRLVAVSCWDLPGVQVRDLNTGDVVLSLKAPAPVRGAAWSADGKQLAAAGANGRVYLWDAERGTLSTVLGGHQAEAVEVAFNREGDLLASCGWDHTLRLWDLQSGRQLLSRPVGQVNFKATGPGLTFCTLEKAKVHFWETTPAVAFRALRGHVGYKGPSCLAIHPGGRLMASGGSDGIRLWDVQVGKEIAYLTTLSAPVLFHPDGKSLFTSGVAGLSRWPMRLNSRCGKRALVIGPPETLLPGNLGHLALSRDGQTLAVALGRGEAAILHGDRLAEKVLLGPQSNLAFVAVSPDGRWVATGTRHGSGINVWDPRTGQRLSEWPSNEAAVAFSPDGRWLVGNSPDEYRSWEAGSWRPTALQFIRDNAWVPGPMAFSPDGKLLAVTRTSQLVALIDPVTGRELATLSAPDLEPIEGLCFSPNSTALAAACSTHFIQLWDLRRIRGQLARIGLDWDQPPYPPAEPVRDPWPLTVEVHNPGK